MNGKKARSLRKVAGGNTPEYKYTRENKTYEVMNKEGKLVKMAFPFYVVALLGTSSRSIYKKLKKSYKANSTQQVSI